jgi:hypothetical protein
MNEVLATAALVTGLALAGRLWVRLPRRIGRAAAWLALGAGVAALAAAPWDPVARMVALGTTLLAAMKSLVYVEWGAAGRRLGWLSYARFAFLWFGMDPGSFARRRANLEWRTHLRLGLLCMLAGTLGALLVRAAGWTWLLAMFVPMSIGFHFGALRVLTAGWRAYGYPVRTLFRNPLASVGLGDFWAGRLNLGYSQMMARVVMLPAEGWLGPRGALMIVFVV